MTTKEFKKIMSKNGLCVDIDIKTHIVTVFHVDFAIHSINSPLVNWGFKVATIDRENITYSALTPIKDGIKKACEKYANTPLNERVSKKDNRAVQLLLRTKKRAIDNADGFIGVFNPHKAIELESLFLIIDSEINELRS